MTRTLWIDSEQFSPIPISHGTYKYATQAETMLLSWATGNESEEVWDATRYRDLPAQMVKALEDADEIWAHNSFWDRTMLNLAPWWPKHLAPLPKWRCSMVQALLHGLPGKLDHLCQIFQLDEGLAKINGKEFIDLFCKPQGRKKTRATRETHPEQWKLFMEYAGRDIPSMREVSRLCPKWNIPGQVDLWHLDQRINDRGFAVDVEFALAAIAATTKAKDDLADRTLELTDGEVERATQRDRLLGFLLKEYGVDLPDMRADTIERRLEDPELPEHVKELLRIRLQASKASTSKYKRIEQMEVGGRMYGCLQFAAANRTGRWGGRGFQPQNQPRPTHKYPAIEQGIAAMKAGCVDLITDDVMALASSCIRSVIVAPPGKKIVTSDLSNIEGRMLAFLAGEEWKLQAFRNFDAGIGPDLYKVAYGRSFNVDPETVEDDSDERQIGKVQELALGYQGGVNAFVTMSATYGVNLDDLAQKVLPTLPPVTFREAQSVYAWASQQKRTYGLSKEVYVACEALKALWRQAHPMTEILWSAYESAARNAILNPRVQFPAGKCVFDRVKNWLRIKLPSGRYLCYPNPKIEGTKISYANVNVYTKKWHRTYTYGGKIAENIDQAASRDVMADAMPRAEDAGYEIVLTIHDDLLTETPDRPEFNDKVLSKLLATNSDWNQGLPLAAKGMTVYRWRK